MIDVRHVAPVFQRQNFGTWYQTKPMLFPMPKRKVTHEVIYLIQNVIKSDNEKLGCDEKKRHK